MSKTTTKQDLMQVQLKRQELEKELACVKMREADLKTELENERIRFLDDNSRQAYQKHLKSTVQMLKTLNPKLSEKSCVFLSVRTYGEYRNLGLFLGFDDDLQWVIVRDSMGASVLVPEVNLK